MPVTYTPIATTTLSSATANYTFSSVPSTYTDLILVVGNLTASATSQGLNMQFNSDTGSNYSVTHLSGNGSSAASGRQSNASNIQIGYAVVGASTTEPSTIIINIQNYSNTTTNKTAISRTSLAGSEVDANVGLWRNTAAINAIKIFTGSANMQTGTTLTLYGIQAA
jgi:hypothetical protein